jgi:hypothetical protein
VLILLWLHYAFFGVIFVVLARDAWRYNVRRIIALREDAKTQVGRSGKGARRRGVLQYCTMVQRAW